ncbi:unnamed protein product, partial [Mesorhabditis spiculigera]
MLAIVRRNDKGVYTVSGSILNAPLSYAKQGPRGSNYFLGRTLRDIKGLTYQFYPDDDVTPKDVGPLIKHWLRKNFGPEGYEPAIFPGRQPYRKMKGATGEGNRTFPDTNFLELEPRT